MYTFGMDGTKLALFEISVDLFAQHGYSNVSMRDIAKTAGIKAGSIYYHFESKETILETIYGFYDHYYTYFIPSTESLLKHVGTEPPKQTLRRALFRFDADVQETMDKIFLIASTQMYCDMRAQELIYRNIFEKSEHRMSALLNRMLELELIEPLDIESFILTLTSLCHSSALRMRTKYPIDWGVWVKSVELLFDQVCER